MSAPADLLCPSAPADAAGAVVIGVVGGTADTPRVAYLDARTPVTAEILSQTGGVGANRVLRTAARCAQGACGHYDGADCALAARLVANLAAAVDRPPPCAIRPSCRWWKQEGRAACARCPQIVTESQSRSAAFRLAAQPPDPVSGISGGE